MGEGTREDAVAAHQTLGACERSTSARMRAGTREDVGAAQQTLGARERLSLRFRARWPFLVLSGPCPAGAPQPIGVTHSVHVPELPAQVLRHLLQDAAHSRWQTPCSPTIPGFFFLFF